MSVDYKDKHMLTAEQKNVWIEALRSGDYEQGRGLYKDNDGCYCAVGILNEILSGGNPYSRAGTDVIDSMPQRHSVWNVITKMNDDGKSFNEIADWIEENL